MRHKAECKIREAAAGLGNKIWYRLDEVRIRAGLHRKVYDKTILDMARLGTIELTGGDTTQMNEDEIRDCVWQGNILHVNFSFSEPLLQNVEAEKSDDEMPLVFDYAPEPIVNEPSSHESSMLLEIEGDQWELFVYLCENIEKKSAIQKIREMIYDYNLRSQKR